MARDMSTPGLCGRVALKTGRRLQAVGCWGVVSLKTRSFQRHESSQPATKQ